MNNNVKLLRIFVAMFFSLVLMSTGVFAGNISKVDVEESSTGITVSGTAETDVSAVAISVYSEDGKTLVTVKTTSVDDSNKYSKKINLAEGTYVVKVADYKGGAFITKENVTVSEKNEDKDTSEEKEDDETETATDEENNEEDEEDEEETAKETTEKSSNPTTGDNIITFVGIFVVAVVGMFVTIRLNKTNKKINKKAKH